MAFHQCEDRHGYAVDGSRMLLAQRMVDGRKAFVLQRVTQLLFMHERPLGLLRISGDRVAQKGCELAHPHVHWLLNELCPY